MGLTVNNNSNSTRLPLELAPSKLLDMSIDTLEASNPAIEASLASGEAQRDYAKILSVCYQDAPPSYPERMYRKFLENVRLDTFARYWCPENGDRRAVVAMFTFLTPLFFSDDVRDASDPDPTHFKYLSDMWSTIPPLINELFHQRESSNQDDEDVDAVIMELYEKANKLHPATSGIIDYDANVRILVMACAQTRVLAGTDAAYGWYADECAAWGQLTMPIRQKDMATVDLPELLEHRYAEGATTLTCVQALVATGLRMSPRVVQWFYKDHPEVFRSSGLHICLVNDVFSYDRDATEAGFLQNYVEYQRRFRLSKPDFDAAIDATTKASNDLIDSFDKSVDAVLAEFKGDRAAGTHESEDGAAAFVILRMAARSALGNIVWSVKAERYSRAGLVLELIEAGCAINKSA